ncbi:5-oxoprolinase subunit PxpB [Halomonas sp. HAL1]|uniref:5-oxoprolinase subunit PxpB n=1 Tax=Halomonas sp. HAL1 TaxID=550984 RepID=UPI00022D27B1|nr:5-oxoprolinase subunit PxpB [Halomonas sp. HAL1]EHA15092.1 allophanate hydrolase subunit 1 [Halomonas sp. HAL1]WKV94165.1 5-oxoprolinase subunit PxpB [Halomonas sp. HAL1]
MILENKDAIRIRRLSLDAIIIEVGLSTEPNMEMQKLVWGLDHIIHEWTGVRETVPGVNNLLIRFNDPQRIDQNISLIEKLTTSKSHLAAPQGKLHRFQVSYGGVGGPDLTETAAYCGLTVDEFVYKHASIRYMVFCIGAHPGFGYLGGLPKAIWASRLEKPRPHVEAGSVAIGGSQTGIIGSSLASGWRLIGTTEAELFSIDKEPPALLEAGDWVEFEIKEVLG